MEINFCRRCGNTVTKKREGVFTCQMGHILFFSSSPAIAVAIVNQKNQILLVTRASNPGKGMLDLPGGFCDWEENLEDCAVRELKEEIGVGPEDYGSLTFLVSRVNDYEYQNEVLKPLDVVFWTRIKKNIQITPADDAADAGWYDLDGLDIDNRIAFKTIRYSLNLLRQKILSA